MPGNCTLHTGKLHTKKGYEEAKVWNGNGANEDKENKEGRAALWVLGIRILERVVSLAAGLVLARLIAPEYFGGLAEMSLVIEAAELISSLGLFEAAKGERKLPEDALDSIFRRSETASILMTAVVCFLADSISSFFRGAFTPEDLRLYSVVLFFHPIVSAETLYAQLSIRETDAETDENANQKTDSGTDIKTDSKQGSSQYTECTAKDRKEKDQGESSHTQNGKDLYEALFRAHVPGILGSYLCGILCALEGQTRRALISIQLLREILDAICLVEQIGWVPKQRTMNRTEKTSGAYAALFRDAGFLLAAGLLDFAAGRIRVLLVGTFAGEEELAFYTRGKKIAGTPAEGLAAAGTFVLLPLLAGKQTREEMGEEVDRAAAREEAALLPLLAIIAVLSPWWVPGLLGEAWRGAIPYIFLFSITYAPYPMQAVHLAAIRAAGRSDLFWKLEIIKKILSFLLLLPALLIPELAEEKGIVSSSAVLLPWTLALSELVLSLLSIPINAIPASALTGCSMREEWKGIPDAIWENGRDLLSLLTGKEWHGKDGRMHGGIRHEETIPGKGDDGA